jgi:hypothetical protein
MVAKTSHSCRKYSKCNIHKFNTVLTFGSFNPSCNMFSNLQYWDKNGSVIENIILSLVMWITVCFLKSISFIYESKLNSSVALILTYYYAITLTMKESILRYTFTQTSRCDLDPWHTDLVNDGEHFFHIILESMNIEDMLLPNFCHFIISIDLDLP